MIDGLQNLSEFNAERSKQHRKMNDNSPRLNGLACPECGEELYDSAPMITLTSFPPQKDVHCASCDFKGYRIA